MSQQEGDERPGVERDLSTHKSKRRCFFGPGSPLSAVVSYSSHSMHIQNVCAYWDPLLISSKRQNSVSPPCLRKWLIARCIKKVQDNFRQNSTED